MESELLYAISRRTEIATRCAVEVIRVDGQFYLAIVLRPAHDRLKVLKCESCVQCSFVWWVNGYHAAGLRGVHQLCVGAASFRSA